MTDASKRPELYNKQVAHQLMVYTEIIADVYSEFKKVIWSNDSQIEIGFYEKHPVTKSNIFLGIWYESWNHFGIPFCITIKFLGHAPVETHDKIRKIIEGRHIKGISFKDFQGFALILFDSDFFNFEDDVKRLALLFQELAKYIGIDLPFA